MKVKIQNRFPFLCMASVFLFLVICTSVEDKELKLRLIKTDLVFFAVMWVISFILSLAKTTTVTISDGAVRIKYPIGERTLDVNSITGLVYTRRSRDRSGKSGGKIHRSELEISYDDGGRSCTVKLNDNASENLYSRLPDDSVPLYSVYYCLRDITGADCRERDVYKFEDNFWDFITGIFK